MGPGAGLELLLQPIVVTLAISREFDRVELDFRHDDAVGLGILVGGVQSEQGGKTVIFDMLELLAKLSPVLKEERTANK